MRALPGPIGLVDPRLGALVFFPVDLVGFAVQLVGRGIGLGDGEEDVDVDVVVYTQTVLPVYARTARTPEGLASEGA